MVIGYLQNIQKLVWQNKHFNINFYKKAVLLNVYNALLWRLSPYRCKKIMALFHNASLHENGSWGLRLPYLFSKKLCLSLEILDIASIITVLS